MCLSIGRSTQESKFRQITGRSELTGAPVWTHFNAKEGWSNFHKGDLVGVICVPLGACQGSCSYDFIVLIWRRIRCLLWSLHFHLCLSHDVVRCVMLMIKLNLASATNWLVLYVWSKAHHGKDIQRISVDPAWSAHVAVNHVDNEHIQRKRNYTIYTWCSTESNWK